VAPIELTTRAVADPAGDIALPPMKSFGAPRVARPETSNSDLAADFLDLSFQLESGRALPVFTRCEEPITVRVTGRAPATLGPDLTRLIHRLRAEAGIDIARTDAAGASIAIEAVGRADIRGALPQ